MRVSAKRLGSGPIIGRFLDQRMGANVNGPSLIRMPDWAEGRLGTYHLYFAHHLGSYIRMAYADDLQGPWTIYSPGVLDITEAPLFYEHLASPDVHVDDECQEIRVYFHGVVSPDPWEAPRQATSYAVSKDGVNFTPANELITESYLRIWQWQGQTFGISLGGRLWRSLDDGRTFERGPILRGMPDGTRHPAVMVKGNRMWVAWSSIGDCPERILMAEIISGRGWPHWELGETLEILRPEEQWEGANLPLIPSQADISPAPTHQLRDPAFYSENGRDYLLYSVAGEAGIALAELRFENQ